MAKVTKLLAQDPDAARQADEVRTEETSTCTHHALCCTNVGVRGRVCTREREKKVPCGILILAGVCFCVEWPFATACGFKEQSRA